MHILLAEDDRKLGRLIVYKLSKERYTVDWVENGVDAVDYVMISEYDLLILDWMMPGMAGIEVSDRVRQKGYDGAILFLTARDSVEDKVEGLDAGADDYLVKPFEFAELLARIRALTRRSQMPLQSEVLQYNGIRLNRKSHHVERNGQTILLTPKEFQLLELFMVNPGQVLPREIIIDRIWGFDSEVTNNNLDALVRLLRKKVDIGQERFIQSIRGVGYKLEKPHV